MKTARLRLVATLLFCCVFGAALVTRAGWVQLRKDPRFEQLSRKQFRSKVLVRPRRGLIVDRNGEALAVNSDIFSLAVNPSRFKSAPKDRVSVARRLAQGLHLHEKRLIQKMTDPHEFAWVKRHLSDQELRSLRVLRILDETGSVVDGLWLVKEAKRIYPHNELAAHIIGSVNLDSEGLEGVELMRNEQLQGKVVSVAAVKDALGRPAFLDAEAAKDVKDGEVVQLTIDAPLQFTVEQELRSAIAEHHAKSGTAIVYDAESGDLLAIANEPSFNPNLGSAKANRRRNRAITDGYEPGSTMKPLLAAIALQHGWRMSDRVYGEKGSIKIQGHVISEAEAHERFEWLSLQQMVQKSSNVVAAKVAMKLGASVMGKGLVALGFAEKTGVDFPGEISGMLGKSDRWQPIHLATLGFGHGVLVTPIQIVRAYGALANKGFAMRPRLLTATQPIAARSLVPFSVAEAVAEAMVKVTEEGGTGTNAAVEGFRVAGKTGTSLVLDAKTGKYVKGRYINTFVGFARDIERKIVVFASIDEPKGGAYAAWNAAPLFRALYSAVVARLSLGAAPSLLVHSHTDRLRTSLAKVGAVQPPKPEGGVARSLQWVDRDENGKSVWRLPSLEGLSIREALRVFESRDFDVEVRGVGTVVGRQSPEAGEVLQEKATVKLTLGLP